MAAPVEFLIKILGGAAGELGKTADGFKKTDKSAKESAEGVKLFDAEAGKLNTTVLGLNINLGEVGKGGARFSFDLAEGMRSAYEVAHKLTEAVVDLTKETFGAVGRVQDLDLALRANLGNEKAEQLHKIADAHARLTRFDDDEFLKPANRLAEEGIKDLGLLDQIGTVAASLSALRNTGKEGYAAYWEAVGDVALKGGEKIKGSILSLGLNPREYYGKVGELIGKSADETMKLASAGKVAKETLLSTIFEMVRLKEGTAEFGGAAQESAATIGGLLDRLGNVKENLLKSLAASPAMQKGQKLLVALLDRLSGPEGAVLVEKFGNALDRAFSSTKVEDVTHALSTTLTVLGGIVTAMEKIVKLAAWIGENDDKYDRLKQQGGVTGAVAHVPFLRMLLSDPDDKGTYAFGSPYSNEQLGREMGTKLGDGVAAGIDASRDKVASAAIKLATTAHEAASGPQGLDAHSPSRKGIELGRFYAQGLAGGMEAESSRLSLSTTRTIAQTIDVAGGTPSLGAGGGQQLPAINIVIQGGGDSRETAREVRLELRRLFTEMGIGMGVADSEAA